MIVTEVIVSQNFTLLVSQICPLGQRVVIQQMKVIDLSWLSLFWRCVFTGAGFATLVSILTKLSQDELTIFPPILT